MDESLNELGESIVGALPGAVSGYTRRVRRTDGPCGGRCARQVLTMLRDDPRFPLVNFIDLCGVDYPARPKRFDVVGTCFRPSTTVASA